MFLGRGKRVISMALTAMMLANLTPAVCYAEEIAEPVAEVVSETEVSLETVVETSVESSSEIEEKETESDASVASSEELEETESATSETETETESKTEREALSEKSYILTADEYEKKVELANLLDTYLNATPGEDYVKGLVINIADSREKAEEIAELYGAELLDYEVTVARYKLSEDMSVADALKLAADLTSFYPAVYPNVIGDSDRMTEIAAAEIIAEASGINETDGNEEEIELESHITSIGNYTDDWLFECDDYYQWHHEVIGSQYAWVNGIKGAGIKLALVSTGIATHDDIPYGDRVKAEYSDSSVTGAANVDTKGGGTFAAGLLIGSLDNSLYGAGICPEADLLNIRVNNNEIASIARGILKAAELNADIALSTAMYDMPVPVLESAVETAYAKGVAVFAPVGSTQDSCDSWPGGYKHVIAVASADKNNMLSSISSTSKNTDIAAPGTFISSYGINNDVEISSSPVFGAVIAAGEAALILSRMENIKGFKDNKGTLIAKGPARVDALKKVMQSSCIAAGPGLGKGIVYLPKALGLGSVTTAMNPPSIQKVGTSHSVGTTEYDMTIEISSADPDTKYILYTIDSGKPSYVNGVKDKNSTMVGGKNAFATVRLNDTNKEAITVNAIAVSNLGVVSKVATGKIMINDKVYCVDVSAPTNKLSPGKSLKLAATVVPSNAKTKNVTWYVSYNGSKNDAKANGVTVSQAGILAAKKDAVNGNYKVWAESKFDPTVKSDAVTVKVTALGIKTIKAKDNKKTVYRNNTNIQYEKSDLYNMFDITKTDDSVASLDDVYFTSSNSKCLLIDSKTNTARAIAPGNAVVTAFAADGSGVKGSFTMTVIQNAVSVMLPSDGYNKVAVGKSVTLAKPVINPANSTVQKVDWSIDAAGAAAGIKVANGKVITTKTSTPGTYDVEAKVTNKDGSTASVKRSITVINDQVTKITTDKTKQIFREGNNFTASTSCFLKVNVEGGERKDGKTLAEAFDITISNPNLLTYTAVSPGTDSLTISVFATGSGVGKVNLTIAARDGSGKKATCTFDIKNPVSNVKIAPAKAGSYSCVTAGKSLALKATVATEYGKTTNTKVIWSLPEGDKVYASISQAGVLTVKATAPNKQQITVIAKAADGSGAADARIVTIYKNVGKLEITNAIGEKTKPSFTTDCYGTGTAFYVKVMDTTPFSFGTFRLASSNGQVGMVRYSGNYYKNESQGCCIYEFHAVGISKGSTKLTVSTADGSQSVSFGLTVKK